MNTDAYQPIEREYRITRAILEVLAECNHPFSLVTKSSLVERDIDIIAPMAAKGLATIFVTITTLDRHITRKSEPRAAAPERRLETLHRLSEAGIPTGVMVAPVIPVLTDFDMENILQQAKNAGAGRAGYVFLRLPHELSQLFQEWLQLNFPLKAEHVMSLVRQSRGGKDYDANFKTRMKGDGLFAELLSKRFKLACQRLELNRERVSFNNSLFKVPEAWRNTQSADSNHSSQLSLF